MSNLFVDVPTIVQQMLDSYKSITGVTLSPSQLDDDNVIKAFTYAGPISALYSQIQRLSNDTFAFSASTSGLKNLLRARSLSPQGQASSAHVQIQFTFTAPATIPIGSQVQLNSNGQVYTTIQSGSGNATTPVTLFVQAVATGNITNVSQLNQPFTLITAISGVVNQCQNVSLGLDGTDVESDASMAARILINDQDQNSGGNVTAYQNWARTASSQVVSVTVLRRLRGPDTVDLVITSGTTDIAGAVASGQPVVRVPSASLISTVQTYVATQNPITDDVLVYGPTTIPLNVTFNFTLFTETSANRSYVGGIITQTIQTYLYSANPTDVLTPSTIERLVDQAIGAQIASRECSNLNGATSYFVVPNSNIIIPGTITLGVLTT